MAVTVLKLGLPIELSAGLAVVILLLVHARRRPQLDLGWLARLIALVLAIYTLVDCVQTPEEQVRGLPSAPEHPIIVRAEADRPRHCQQNAEPRRRGPFGARCRRRAPRRGGTGERRPPWWRGR